jgi:hypothetical protein
MFRKSAQINILRNIYEELPEECLYIAVDRDLNKLLLLKDVIEINIS